MSRAPNGIYPGELVGTLGLVKDRNIGYKATGEFRPPKKGEFYLSGAIVAAYRAPNDLTSSYWIAVPGRVKVEIKTIWTPLK